MHVLTWLLCSLGPQLATLYVENLLAVHHKYTTMVASTFDRDQQFQEAMHRAFESVINSKQGKNSPKSPEIIAKWVDDLTA